MAEQDQRLAAGAVGVQVDGDHNTTWIITGGARFALQKLHTRKTTPTTPIELLRSDVRATTLVGRATWLAESAAWRDAKARIAVRCITGPAGAGKTRLAIEACEAAAGWIAGFAPSGELARFHATQNLVHWVLPQDALIVVDYAATSLAVLKAWFALLAPSRDRREGGKLRLLLLERQADPENGWWADLTRRESADRAGPADLTGPDALSQLPALTAVEDRRSLLAETMRCAAPLLGLPVQTPPPPGADPGFDARLGDDRIDNEPLYLMMAGVHAARYGAPAALSLNGIALAREMAEIETARLERFATARGFKDDGALLKHLAACVTLQNGCALSSLTGLVADEMAALGLTAPFGAEAVAERLCDTMPVTAGLIEPVRPDLIGESFCLSIVQGSRLRSEDARHAIVLRAYRRSEAGTVDTLIRSARDLAEGSADHVSVRWLRMIADVSQNLAELFQIADLLPEITLALREVAANVNGRITDILANVTKNEPDAVTPVLAFSLNAFAKRLSDLGRHEEALAAAEKAVRLRRILAVARPDAFTVVLARSLNNLANVLSDLGRHEEALASAQEAMRLRRTLAFERPDAFTPDLAQSLHNLAKFLGRLGRREEGLAASEEASRLYHGLAFARPYEFTPALASTLNNLAAARSSLGLREGALAAAEVSVRLRRELAAERPDAFTPDLAQSLNNLSNFLGDLGRREEALAAAEEAVRLRRVLATARPDAFAPVLAGALNNLANILDDLGRREESLAAAEEAVRLRRILAATRPDAFTPDLAQSLNNLAKFFDVLGRREEALAVAEEAVRLYRVLAVARPDAFKPELAGSLNNLANILGELERREEALATAEEAVRLHRVLTAAWPDAFNPELAKSLSVLGDTLEAVGRLLEALAADEQAIRALRPCFLRRAVVFRPAMLAYIRDYLRRCNTAGREPDGDLLDPIAKLLQDTGKPE